MLMAPFKCCGLSRGFVVVGRGVLFWYVCHRCIIFPFLCCIWIWLVYVCRVLFVLVVLVIVIEISNVSALRGD